MFYHVTVGANRYVIEQDTVLQNFLASLGALDIAVVKSMEYVDRGTSIWGALPGANPLPSLIDPPPTVNSFNVSHLTINSQPY